MNGGPGSSSMFGLFVEQGPLRIKRTGDTVDDFIVGPSKVGSWLELADLVYID